jgi:PAS domain S-box-containing protein
MNTLTNRPVATRSSALVIGLIATLVAGLIASAVIWKLDQSWLHSAKADASMVAAEHGNLIEVRVNAALSATHALAALVEQSDGQIRNFDTIAKSLMEHHRDILLLQLAPGGVIRHAYPLPGNEKSLGFDLFADPARRKDALLARDSGLLTLAGPQKMVQGGVGVMGRLPIFLTARNSDTPAFWGLAIATLRIPEALGLAGVNQLSADGYAFKLWKKDPNTGKEQIIASAGSTGLLASDFVRHPVIVPNGVWNLDVAPARGWRDQKSLLLAVLVGSVLSLLLGWMAYASQSLAILGENLAANPVYVASRLPIGQGGSRTAGRSPLRMASGHLTTIFILSLPILILYGISAVLRILDGYSDQLMFCAILSLALALWASVECIVARRTLNVRAMTWLSVAVHLQTAIGIVRLPLLHYRIGFDHNVDQLYAGPILTSVIIVGVLTGTFLAISMIILNLLLSEHKQRAVSIEDQMLSSLNALSLARDNETGNHIVRTQHYVRLLAVRMRAMGLYRNELSDDVIEALYRAAPLHDIGKVGIPDFILLKPGKLTPAEWETMQSHATIGESVLSTTRDQSQSHSTVLDVAIQVAAAHHEKWDGTGYPRGLKGEDIPLTARIMAVADMYDALVSERPYKKPWTHDAAMAEFIKLKGTQLDPAVVDAFVVEESAFREIAIRYADNMHGKGTPESQPSVLASPIPLGPLNRRDEKFRTLFDQTTIGMVLIDHKSGAFIEVNDYMSRLTGYSREELLTCTFWDMTPAEYTALEYAQVLELNRTGKFGPYTKEYTRKDGTRCPIRMSGFKMAGTDGQVVVWAIIDDTSHASATQSPASPATPSTGFAPAA